MRFSNFDELTRKIDAYPVEQLAPEGWWVNDIDNQTELHTTPVHDPWDLDSWADLGHVISINPDTRERDYTIVKRKNLFEPGQAIAGFYREANSQLLQVSFPPERDALVPVSLASLDARAFLKMSYILFDRGADLLRNN